MIATCFIEFIFNYTVSEGQVSSDLDYVGTGSLALNNGSIKDLSGNSATLTLASPGATNSLGANAAIVVDGVIPVISSVSTTTSNGSYKIGDAIAVNVIFSEVVTVSGTPQLTLETGSSDADASDNTEIEGVSVEVKVNSGELISF